MSLYFIFAVLGLGSGAVYAAFGIGLVVTYRASGVINFAYGAIAMTATYVYAYLRSTGDLTLPIKGVGGIGLGGPMPLLPAAAIAVLFSCVLSIVLHVVVFRPLRHAPTLAKAVAAVGVMLTLEALVVLRYGSNSVLVRPVLPSKPINLFGQLVPQDRLWLSGVAIVVAVLFAVVGRYTRFGLATRAAAENERGASALGYSPDAIAWTNSLLSGALAAIVGILVAPVVSLAPETYTLLIVPALGVALLARFQSFAVCVVGGLAMGACQSMLQHWALSAGGWVSQAGIQDALPFLVIVVVIAWGGRGLPTRGDVIDGRLPAAPLPRRVPLNAAVWFVVALVALVVVDSSWRLALITSMIEAVLCLSIVVLTGFLGQVSLAQLTFAGVAGFSLSKFGHGWGIPFPVSPVLAVLLAGVLGLVVGLPAVRIRGVNLALVTIAGAVAVTDLVFKNPGFTGGFQGSPIPDPHLGGVNFAIASPGHYPRLTFAVLVLVVLALLCVGVNRLRLSAYGRRMLAVRANERAAAAVGINVAMVKLSGFGLSSLIAGVGGVLLAYSQPGGNLSADSYAVLASIGLFAIAYLGGIGTVSGAVVGGVLCTGGLVFFGLSQVASGFQSYQALIGGLGLVLTAVLNPDGIAGGALASLRRLRSGLARPPATTDGDAAGRQESPAPQGVAS